MPESYFDNISTHLKPLGLSLTKGETLFQQGGVVERIYCVKTGKIKLIRNTIEGTPITLHIAQSGETFAEASLFSNRYHCSAIADSKTEIIYFRKPDLLNYLEQNPAAMKNLLTTFSHQVRELRAINEIKNIRSAKERILAFIRSEMNENMELVLSMSLKDVAHRIGLAHETFYREIKNLEKSGKIMRYDRTIKLS